MDPRFKPLLDYCAISEQEFLNGIPAVLIVGNDMPATKIVAVYEGGKILIESSTYISTQQYRRYLQGQSLEVAMVEPVVVEDLGTIQAVLDRILKEGTITKMLYEDDEEFRLKKEYARSLSKII
jgi:hypothetical protein